MALCVIFILFPIVKNRKQGKKLGASRFELIMVVCGTHGTPLSQQIAADYKMVW